MVMVMVMIRGIRGEGLMFKSLFMFRRILYSIMGNTLYLCLFQVLGMFRLGVHCGIFNIDVYLKL